LRTRRRRGEEAGKFVIKSRDPHLAGGEFGDTQCTNKFIEEAHPGCFCFMALV